MNKHEEKLNHLKCSLCDFQFYKAKELRKHKHEKHSSTKLKIGNLTFLKPKSLKYQPDQLWYFLLNLLNDKSNENIIAWTSNKWEFKLKDPNEVARRWGLKKNKPMMNYEKLSRVLRFYYSRNILEKSQKQNFVYKFLIDIESVLKELNTSLV